MDKLSVYIPMDRRQAMVRGLALPDHSMGAALFADISGFTPLTEVLAQELGAQRGAEELLHQLNRVYDALVAQVHLYGGSVIGFVGDAIICWFDGDDGQQAGICARTVTCALAMQQAMQPFASVQIVPGITTALSIKIGIGAGPVRRFRVGDPDIQYLDVLAGDTLRRMSLAEGLAFQGEVLLDTATAGALGHSVTIGAWRTHARAGERFGVVAELGAAAAPAPWPELAAGALSLEQVRPWVLPPVYERLQAGQGEFLAELRSTASLFLKFGGLDYDHDPAAGDKLDAYVRWGQRVLGRYEGILVQLTIGDKGSFLYAAFGAPIAHDDDARRAVMAALELQAPPSELAFIIAQIGIARGQARTGAYGSHTRRSYSIIGNDVVLAARLMDVAPPGEIRCDYKVYRQVKRHFDFDGLAPVRVKGRAGLIRVYRPVAVRDRRTGAAQDEQEAIVGRRAELAQLEANLAAIQAGETRVLIIGGEAGIGKSRLVAELVRWVRAQGLTGLLGTGQSIEQQTPYRAWRDVFISYFDIDDVSDPLERRRRVQTVVNQVAPEQAQRLPLLNDLLNLGLPDNELTAALDPNLRQQSLALLLTQLLETWAREQPLVVVLEDAHWLDSLSWELAGQVVRSLEVSMAQFLLVVVHRPLDEGSLGQQGLVRLQDLKITQTLPLAALDPAEISELVAGRLGIPNGELPPAVVELVQTRANGNPFFAEELIFALRDQQVIQIVPSHTTPHTSRCIVTGDLAQASEALPDTLHGLILSRIDRLPPERQIVLKIAAVIGHTFAYPPLHHTLNLYADVVERALKDHLQRLEKADFTLLETLEPELTYVFKHIITQETTYQTLLYAQRRRLHRIVAEWYEHTLDLESLAAYYPLLVHHYHHARDGGKERHYARLAGEQATAQFANEEAVAYLSRALELTPETDLTARYELLLAREKVYDVQGDRETQALDLGALETLAETLADDRCRAEVALRQAVYAEVTGDFDRSIAAARRAVAVAQSGVGGEPGITLAARGQVAWGKSLVWKSAYGEAQVKLAEALNALARSGAAREAVHARRVLGISFYYQAQYETAQETWQAAVDSYRALGDLWGEAATLNNLGLVAWALGDLSAAQTLYQQALDIQRKIGDRWSEGNTLNNLGLAVQNQGDLVGARELFHQHLALRREIGDRQGVGLALTNLGVVTRVLGDLEGAQAFYQQALDIRREVGDRQGMGLVLNNLGSVACSLGDLDTAQTLLERALAIRREINDRRGEGSTLYNLGLVAYDAGDQAAAQEFFRQALSIHQELGQPQYQAEDEAGLARVALARGDLSEALAHIHEVLAYQEGNPSLDGITYPFLVFLTCYRVLTAAQDPRAAESLRTAYTLLQERAANIPNKAARRSFLQNLPPHRELVREYERLTGTS